MKRTFTAKCPYCREVITGYDNWEEGRICISGHCRNCARFIGEDEADWKEPQEPTKEE